MGRAAFLAVSLALALLLGACSDDEEGSPPTPAPPAAEPLQDETGPLGGAAPADGAARPDEAAPPGDAARPGEDSIAIVRAWSAALNSGDNAGAADLFAPEALVIQGAGSVALLDHDSARRFHESLPCSGQIVDISITGDVVTAVFELGHRETSQCDAPPGTLAAAEFLLEGGKILIWRQIAVPVEDPASPGSSV